jgi:hypothetical protein
MPYIVVQGFWQQLIRIREAEQRNVQEANWAQPCWEHQEGADQVWSAFEACVGMFPELLHISAVDGS